MEFGSVHEGMREASKQVLELYGEHARDWAPREVAEITENAQLGWMANLTDALEIWRAKIHEEMSDGERILAYVNLGMLLECWLTLYLCVWLRDYKKQAKDGRMPYELTFNEMETFFDLCPCRIYGVTGSDGKTTTTTLIAEMLAKTGRRVFKGGNIGKALLPLIETIREEDAAVVELSSFQLISMRRSPDVAVITNISPNHLDVHGTMEEYISCKVNLIAHQNAYSRTVLNLDNAGTAALAEQVRGNLLWFTRQQKPERGTFLDEEGWLCYGESGKIQRIVRAEDIRIPGLHNVENYLAAIAAVWGEVPADTIVEVAKNFGGVEHRIEFVRELDGVKWYNDSIATSPTRVLAGLRSFNQRLIVIAGGYDKKIPFEPMAETVNQRVKILILMGVTAPKIEKAITEDPSYDPAKLQIVHAASMEEAVQKAKELAQPGDIVTLSPACASFDLYPNFEARGQHFKTLVKEL